MVILKRRRFILNLKNLEIKNKKKVYACKIIPLFPNKRKKTTDIIYTAWCMRWDNNAWQCIYFDPSCQPRKKPCVKKVGWSACNFFYLKLSTIMGFYNCSKNKKLLVKWRIIMPFEINIANSKNINEKDNLTNK